MPKITFLNDQLEADVPSRVALPVAANEAGASLPFGCRAGTCGTCVLQVVDGAENVAPAGFVEDDTLHVLGLAGAGKRLGCQIIVGDGDLSVKW